MAGAVVVVVGAVVAGSVVGAARVGAATKKNAVSRRVGFMVPCLPRGGATAPAGIVTNVKNMGGTPMPRYLSSTVARFGFELFS